MLVAYKPPVNQPQVPPPGSSGNSCFRDNRLLSSSCLECGRPPSRYFCPGTKVGILRPSWTRACVEMPKAAAFLARLPIGPGGQRGARHPENRTWKARKAHINVSSRLECERDAACAQAGRSSDLAGRAVRGVIGWNTGTAENRSRNLKLSHFGAGKPDSTSASAGGRCPAFRGWAFSRKGSRCLIYLGGGVAQLVRAAES
jgi:hypothetical protein